MSNRQIKKGRENDLYLRCIDLLWLIFNTDPFSKKLAFRIGAVDHPNKRKVHQTIMPRLGGLAIFFSFVIGILFSTRRSV